VVESVYSVELYLRGLGGVLVGRTDRLECVVRQEVERRDMGIGAPAAAALRHGRADDAGADSVSHGCVSPLGGCRAGATEARMVRRELGIIQCILNCLLSIVAGFLWRVEGGGGETKDAADRATGAICVSCTAPAASPRRALASGRPLPRAR